MIPSCPPWYHVKNAEVEYGQESADSLSLTGRKLKNTSYASALNVGTLNAQRANVSSFYSMP